MKASELDFDSLLDRKPEDGRLELGGERAVISDASAAYRLAEELEETLGRQAARGVLTRYGYQTGYREAVRLRNYFEWDSELEWLRAAARTQTVLGVGRVELRDVVVDRARGVFRVEAGVAQSFEAQEHRRQRGPASEPVCDRLTGFLSGFGSAYLGDDVLFIETACAAIEDGDRGCRFEGRLAPEWGALGRRHKELYARDAIGERLASRDREVLAQAVKIREQEMLLEAQRKVEEASRLKSEFLANISHELRTPLNSIIGYADLLLAKLGRKLPQTPRQNLERILSNAGNLLELINSVLDISKIEAGRMDLHLEDVDIRGLLIQLAEDTQVVLKDEPVELIFSQERDLPPVRVDRLRFEQCLRNVLGNAAKFTEQGSITLEAKTLQAQRDGGSVPLVAIAVADTGPGLPAEKQALIFEPFRQADASTTRRHGGTGLGLPIVRELMQLMGGEIRLTSEPGAGSTFTLLAPAAGPAAAAEAEAEPEPGEEADEASTTGILMIDDDPDFCAIAREAVGESPALAGLAFAVEADPVRAIAAARVAPPALIVLDLRLPNVDGREVLRLLQRDERTRRIPVVAVSVRDDVRATVAEGASAALQKPVGPAKLVEALERALGVGAGAGGDGP